MGGKSPEWGLEKDGCKGGLGSTGGKGLSRKGAAKRKEDIHCSLYKMASKQ